MSQCPAADARPLAYVNGTLAYLVWGVVGLFFRHLTVAHGVPPFTLLAHRVVWSLTFVVGMLCLTGQREDVIRACRDRRVALGLLATSLLIAINWLTFIHAAATAQLVSASLGYFLAPIVTVLLGVGLLGERLRRPQWLAVAFAAVGVALLVVMKARSAWIPIALTLSWSFYVLLRKRLAVGPIVGLGVETAMMLPLAIGYIALTQFARPTVTIGASSYALLVAAGVITAVPLMLFAYAARRLPMVTLGLMQYVGPTVQLFVAWAVAGEPVDGRDLVSFGMIWLGLIVFTVDGVRAAQRRSISASQE